MTLDTHVELPRWALDAGMPPAIAAETFREYFGRVGMDTDLVDMCFAGLTKRTACVANARVAQYIRQMCPQAFEKNLARRLSVLRRHGHL